VFTDRTPVSWVFCLLSLVSLASCFGKAIKIKEATLRWRDSKAMAAARVEKQDLATDLVRSLTARSRRTDFSSNGGVGGSGGSAGGVAALGTMAGADRGGSTSVGDVGG